MDTDNIMNKKEEEEEKDDTNIKEYERKCKRRINGDGDARGGTKTQVT